MENNSHSAVKYRGGHKASNKDIRTLSVENERIFKKAVLIPNSQSTLGRGTSSIT